MRATAEELQQRLQGCKVNALFVQLFIMFALRSKRSWRKTDTKKRQRVLSSPQRARTSTARAKTEGEGLDLISCD